MVRAVLFAGILAVTGAAQAQTVYFPPEVSCRPGTSVTIHNEVVNENPWTAFMSGKQELDWTTWQIGEFWGDGRDGEELWIFDPGESIPMSFFVQIFPTQAPGLYRGYVLWFAWPKPAAYPEDWHPELGTEYEVRGDFAIRVLNVPEPSAVLLLAAACVPWTRRLRRHHTAVGALEGKDAAGGAAREATQARGTL